MRLILNRQVKVAGVMLPTETDVTDLSKDYRASIEHNGWATWQEPIEAIELKQGQSINAPASVSIVQQEPKEETKPVEQVAKPVQRPQRKPKK